MQLSERKFYPVRNELLSGANRVKKIQAFFLIAFFFVFSAGPALASVSFDNSLKNTAEFGAGYLPVANNPGNFFLRLLGTFMAPFFMGVIGTIIMSYGGYKWMMARGDEQEVEKAKTIIVNTIIALIVVFSPFVILNMVIPLWKFVTE